MNRKIRGKKALEGIIQDLRKKEKRIVFTNGCFDLLHVGHLRYLEKAKSLGHILVVGLNSDRSVRELKGTSRPIFPEKERAEILAGLACVDYVTIFNEATPLNLISRLRPDILVKGGDWKKQDVVGREIVERTGGSVRILPFVKGSSTTNVIQTILERYEKRA